MNRFLAIIFLVIIGGNINAQYMHGTNLDKIVLVVGDHIALQSDINQLYNEYKAQDPNMDDSMVCGIIENTLTKYVLCEQAAKDSILVSEEEVEGTLDNRLRYMMQAYGSQEAMERTVGKSVFQIKEEYRRFFKDQILAQKMQGQVVSTVKVTPAEVRAFFDKIPKDSLPTYPSMMEVGQIVFKPVANKEVEDYTKQQLLDIRKQILEEGADFATLAGIYSADPGSKDLGGNLGVVSRDELVPEFSGAAFKLQNGETSMPVKSPFGYHLIQMIQRMGEKAKIRHILIKPTITSVDIETCKVKADSVKNLITSGKMTFQDAVAKFTQDEFSKTTNGMFVSQATGSSLVSIEELDANVAAEVTSMKVGDYTAAMAYDVEGNPLSSTTKNENKQVRFLYLKTITEPHVADLKTDFARIQKVALEEKSGKHLSTWIENKTDQFYIFIDENYQDCTINSKVKSKKN